MRSGTPGAWLGSTFTSGSCAATEGATPIPRWRRWWITSRTWSSGWASITSRWGPTSTARRCRRTSGTRRGCRSSCARSRSAGSPGRTCASSSTATGSACSGRPGARSGDRLGALELLPVLLAELRHFRRDHGAAIRLVAVVREILLVVVLGFVKRGKRLDLGYDRRTPQLGLRELLDDLLRRCLLLRGAIEDRGAILSPDVRPLAVRRRGIVGRKEHLQDLPERDHGRVERDLHDLRVPGRAGADLLVGRVRDGPAGVP